MVYNFVTGHSFKIDELRHIDDETYKVRCIGSRAIRVFTKNGHLFQCGYFVLFQCPLFVIYGGNAKPFVITDSSVANVA